MLLNVIELAEPGDVILASLRVAKIMKLKRCASGYRSLIAVDEAKKKLA